MEYKIHLLLSGLNITGSGEKIREINSVNSILEYDIEKRVQLIVYGYYHRRYLQKSKVYLNIHEEGRLRQSRATYSLTILKKNKSITLGGTFISTAANSRGSVEMVQL